MYMTELIQQRKAAVTKEERYDLFSSLLDANDQDAEVTLTDSELLGTLTLIAVMNMLLLFFSQEIYSSSYWQVRVPSEVVIVVLTPQVNPPNRSRSSYFFTSLRFSVLIIRCVLRRPRPTRFVIHSHCWHFIKMNKTSYTNTSKIRSLTRKSL